MPVAFENAYAGENGKDGVREEGDADAEPEIVSVGGVRLVLLVRRGWGWERELTV